VLVRVLYLWAIRHPASSYVQGINELIIPFFVVFLSTAGTGHPPRPFPVTTATPCIQSPMCVVPCRVRRAV
jgi:hypothetical protein